MALVFDKNYLSAKNRYYSFKNINVWPNFLNHLLITFSSRLEYLRACFSLECPTYQSNPLEGL